jgi:fatty-acyl-CoA synthase
LSAPAPCSLSTEIVSRRPDKSLVRHTFGAYYRRTRALASALQGLGLQKGDRVATLCWNHHAHLECYFGIPAAGGVMHTLNLRLSPDEIGWIAADAKDRFLVIDDVLLPLYRSSRTCTPSRRSSSFPSPAPRCRPNSPTTRPARHGRPGRLSIRAP